MLSVVPLVNTISFIEPALMNFRTVSRLASCSSVACCDRKCTPRCTLALTDPHRQSDPPALCRRLPSWHPPHNVASVSSPHYPNRPMVCRTLHGIVSENQLLSVEYHTCCLGINIFSLAYRTALAFIQFTTETFLNQEM